MEEPSDGELIELDEFDPEEFYKEWASCQNKYIIKILALMFMDTFRTRFGLTDGAAASEAGVL